MKEIYIFCPNYITGGVELLHQLCNKLNKLSCKAYLTDVEGKIYDIPKEYKNYNNIYKNITEYNSNTVLIFPEIYVHYANKDLYKDCIKIIYWESVDNYFDWTPVSSLYQFPTNCYYLTQSYYAYDFLHKLNINEDNIFQLTDYINDYYCDNNKFIKADRERIILYNPKKGIDITNLIIKAMPDETFIPIKNMSREQILEAMQSATLYIDFGKHPGKDRIPREAAVCGCCVITNRSGAAQFYDDIPIDDMFKFDDLSNAENFVELLCTITNILNDWEYYMTYFTKYRNKIMGEHKLFDTQVENLVEKLSLNKED